jgi:hypothetical protein
VFFHKFPVKTIEQYSRKLVRHQFESELTDVETKEVERLLVRENGDALSLGKERKRVITESETSRHGTFEPEPLPDEVTSSSKLSSSQAAEISPIRTKPVVGEPTSSPGNTSEGIASNVAGISEEQMTNSSPAGDPAAAVQRRKGNPTLDESHG